VLVKTSSLAPLVQQRFISTQKKRLETSFVWISYVLSLCYLPGCWEGPSCIKWKTVMWGRTYTRRRHARDVQRAAERVERAGTAQDEPAIGG
jgi:hypothetical protein